MTISTRAAALAVTVLATFAASGCATYSVRKSALSPHIAPPMRNGFGMPEHAEASVGASTLATTSPPREGDGANAGLHIPRVELGAALRGRLSENFDVGLLWDQGLRQGAYKTSADQPSPDNGSVYGAGASMFASIPTATPSFRIGLGLDLMAYSVPYVEYSTCVENCYGAPYTTVDEGRELIGVYSLSVIPSFRTGPLTLFAGGTVRNHPTVEKGSLETDADDIFDDEVREGPANFLVSAGAEIELGAGVRAMGMIYQPLTRDPVEYGPTFGAALTIPLGRRAPSRAAPPASAAQARR